MESSIGSQNSRMAEKDAYDYSVTKHHLQPFVNPLTSQPFFEEMAETYGDLWEFRPHIPTWTFGVSRWKNFVFIRYREERSNTYLPWNLKEKVAIIESHREDFIVIVLREVDENGIEQDHCHSIVIDTNKHHARFDIDNLMTFLDGSEMSSLNNEFIKSGYVPWVESSAKSNANRLMRIFQTLDQYALANVCVEPAPRRTPVQSNRAASNPRQQLASTPGRSGSRGPRPSQPRSESRKRAPPSSEAAGSSGKRRKSFPGPSTVPGPAQTAGSSGSALTNATARGASSEEKL